MCVFENARFFFGNVFLAALKCLTYFIRSSKTFYKLPFVRIHLKYCLERNSQPPSPSPELTTLCLYPGSQEKDIQSSKPLWSWVERNHSPILFGFFVYIVYVKDRGVLIYNI